MNRGSEKTESEFGKTELESGKTESEPKLLLRGGRLGFDCAEDGKRFGTDSDKELPSPDWLIRC